MNNLTKIKKNIIKLIQISILKSQGQKTVGFNMIRFDM